MSSQKVCCLQALGLPQDLADENLTNSISKLISLAVSEQVHSVSLKEIYETIMRYEFAAYLEPLDILPALLPCRHDGAIDLIRLCAYNDGISPKEVLIVLQEAIEYLQARLTQDEEEEENDPSLVQRTIGIVLLCAGAISRSKLGKRSGLELCSPILENITSLIPSVSPLATREEGRTLLTEMANMIKCLGHWTSILTNANERQSIKCLLRQLLDTTIMGCAPSIQSSLALRAAEAHFPRSFVRTYSDREQLRDDVMFTVEMALGSIGDTPKTIPWKPTSFVDLVYLAHSTTPLPLSLSSLPDFHHLLVSALQMNMVLDEALFLFFRILTDQNTSIPPEFATSLCTVFTALASTHLDSTIRQLNLRLLSLTLSKLPPAPRLETLLKLTTDEDFPQIRGPAIGLIKEAVLEALAFPPDHTPRSPFASPELLRIFGGILFRPNPPEFFGEKRTREQLVQSLELLRIADCLSFYYVLLQRDHENKTRVRSKDNITSVQSSILRPLRRFLEEHTGGEEPPLMALLSLQVSLDRIDSALSTLDLEKHTRYAERCMTDTLC